jgi:predicted transcriptional regulator
MNMLGRDRKTVYELLQRINKLEVEQTEIKKELSKWKPPTSTIVETNKILSLSKQLQSVFMALSRLKESDALIISKELGQSRSTISMKLCILENQGYIFSYRKGHNKIFKISY